MIEVEGPDGVIIEFPAGTPAETIKSVMQKRYGGPQPFSDTRSTAFLNRGIASVVGAPVDVVNSALSLIGMASDEPFGGSASIESGMREVLGQRNVPEIGEAPRSMGEQALQGVGAAAGVLLPVAGVGRVVNAGVGAGQGIGRMMTDPFVRAPMTSIATELSAGAAAPVAGEVAARNAPEGYEDLARSIAEIPGGVAGGVAATGAGSAARGAIGAVGQLPIGRAITRSVAPYTRTGGRIAAEDRVRALAGNPEKAARRAMEGDPRLTPAQRTGDPRLVALERATVEGDARAQDVIESRLRGAEVGLSREAALPEAGGDPQAARTFLGQLQTRFRDRLRGMVDDATTKARREVERATEDAMRAERTADPQTARMEASEIVRRNIEAAYDRAKTEERRLWQSLPREAPMSSERLLATYGRLSDDLAAALKDDMPANARRLLGEDGVLAMPTDLRELHGFYSNMREVARIAGAGPGGGRRNLQRIANELADAAWEDLIGGPTPTTPLGRQLDAARTFSREFNETFSQGTVGQVLGTRREGGDAIDAGLTLAETVGRGGQRGAIAARDLARGGANTPEAQAATGDYLLRQFNDTARRRDGTMNVDAADVFMRENAEILDQLPDVKRRIQSVIDAGARRETVESAATRATDAANERAIGLRRTFEDPARNPGAAFAGARYGDEISGVLRSRDPRTAARALRAQAARDTSGEALAGIRRAALDRTLKDASVNGRLDGARLMAALRDKNTRGVLSQLMDRQQIRRLQQIATELSKAGIARGATPDIGGVLDDPGSRIIDTLARVLGARVGAATGAGGGSSIQTAAIGSERVRAWVGSLTRNKAEALIREAIMSQDGQLLADLLTNTTTRQGAARIDRRLPALIGAIAAAEGED